MTTDILIVSVGKHFNYLKYCLRSIAKFASGFGQVRLVVPGVDFEAAVNLVRENCPTAHVTCGDEWPGKGFLWHEYIVTTAPEHCPGADFILHMDSDCVFTEPVKPEDYFIEGKPILMYASFDWLVPQQGNLLNWKVAAQNALGFEVTQETMRRHPAVHYRKTYAKTKDCIEDHHDTSLAAYIMQQKESFPQSYAEFPTLGAVAWKFFPRDYFWWDQEINGFPRPKLMQAWSHREVTNEDMTLYKDLGIA